MKAELVAAGFPGVQEDQGVVHARLPYSQAEFQAIELGAIWLLSLTRPVRGDASQLAIWQAGHPGATLDICQGETRLTLPVRTGPQDLRQWADFAEDFVRATLEWRRGQRRRGEGF